VGFDVGMDRTRRTIHEEMGGEEVVGAVVAALHRRLLADPSLRPYFEGRDMARLQAHQQAMLSVALGASGAEYDGRMMHPAHAGLAVTHEAFDRVLSHLGAVLDEARVPEGTSAAVLAILRPLRTDVVQAPVVALR
jgi:hemoglobin